MGVEKWTCRKKSEFDVRSNTDIIIITYNFIGDAASNAAFLLSDTVIVSVMTTPNCCLS